MNTFKRNIEWTFGEKGEHWLAELPQIINELTIHWELSEITPVENMTFNYVAKSLTPSNRPVILKISCDKNTISQEKQALKYFEGQGAIRLIAENEKYLALLLQQAIPGIPLTSLYPSQPEYVMDAYIDTMRKLHNKCLPAGTSFPHICDWLTAIDRLNNHHSSPLITKAVTLKNQLLASMTSKTFLHGDLHHDNILKEGDEWVAIDPKGVIGEPEFEIAAFNFMSIKELANHPNAKKIIESTIHLLAHKSNLNSERIKNWLFVRLILMAVWQIEDNDNPQWTMTLAEALT